MDIDSLFLFIPPFYAYGGSASIFIPWYILTVMARLYLLLMSSNINPSCSSSISYLDEIVIPHLLHCFSLLQRRYNFDTKWLAMAPLFVIIPFHTCL